MSNDDNDIRIRRSSSWLSKKLCVVCGSKAIGINFGASTCSPCKGKSVTSKDFDCYYYCCCLAFFRRNARRQKVKLKF
mgnify:FL=1